MASKISDLTSTTPGRGWFAPLLDASDTTLAATGTDKRSTLASILGLLQASDLPTVLFAGDGFTPISNTTTATSLFGGGTVRRGSRTIPANTVQAGSRIRLFLAGHWSTTGAPTVAIAVKLGATTLLSSGTAGGPTGVSNAAWYTESPIEICVTAGGAGGACFVVSSLVRALQTNGTVTGNLTLVPTMAAPQSAISIDWTAAQTIDVTWAFGTASASNASTLDAASMLIF